MPRRFVPFDQIFGRVPQCPTGQPPTQGAEPPKRSSRIRQPVFQPNNVYGDRNPADIFQQPDNATPGPDSQRPGNSDALPMGQALQPDALRKQDFSKIVREGGN